MRHKSDGENPSGGSDRYALRVLRLECGQSADVLTLSPEYMGCLVHYHKRRSVYCPGPQDCPANLHREELLYKGYFAGEVYVPDTRLWYPTVCELTESAEVDVRGRYKRGQVWNLRRNAAQRGRKSPLVASYVRSVQADDVPPDFDYMPILQVVYHTTNLILDATNPMPGRVFAAPHTGTFTMTDDGGADREDPLSVRNTFKRLMEERGKNGNGGGK